MEHELQTPLGIIRCGFYNDSIANSTKKTAYKNGCSESFMTVGHKIEIVSFKIRQPLYNGETVVDTNAWIFRIEKNNDIKEDIETYCLFEKNCDNVEFDISAGEHLDSIQAENKDWTLHIGTEDGEMLNSRAANNDWYPKRLENKVEAYQSITDTRQNGFTTKIPSLNIGEKIHIQYLTAYDKKDNNKVNTWLAVDESIRNLENWIGLT